MAHHLAVDRPLELDWMQHGNCRVVPHEVMFPIDGVGVEIAKKVCEGCPVREECLEYALTHREDYGVWGGQSERARRKILRQRRSLR